jgi:hypothetical protein
MSSELFYPRAYVEEAEEAYRPKKAIVNNPFSQSDEEKRNFGEDSGEFEVDEEVEKLNWAQ